MWTLLALCLTFLVESLVSPHALHDLATVKGNCERACETLPVLHDSCLLQGPGELNGARRRFL